MSKRVENISDLDRLVRRLSASEMDAFESLYHLYAIKVFNFSKKYVRSDEDAQEIVQDVFMKIWKVRKTIDLEQSFNGLVFQITKNLALNKIRTRVGEPESFKTIKEDIPGLNLTEQQVLFDETRNILEAAIEGLPPKRQEIFRLSRQKGLSNKEIAGQLNISVNTVEGQMRKAIKYLRSYVDWASSVILLFLFR